MEASSNLSSPPKSPLMLWFTLRYLVNRYTLVDGVPYELLSRETGYCNSGVRKLVKQLQQLELAEVVRAGFGQGKLARVKPVGRHELADVDPRWDARLRQLDLGEEPGAEDIVPPREHEHAA
jgi:hypothetical protein